MKAVSSAPFSLLAVVIAVSALSGCVSNAKYEDMRERAQKAEAALTAERAEANELLRFAAKQDQYIRQLHGGMEIQARQMANLRDNCSL